MYTFCYGFTHHWIQSTRRTIVDSYFVFSTLCFLFDTIPPFYTLYHILNFFVNNTDCIWICFVFSFTFAPEQNKQTKSQTNKQNTRTVQCTRNEDCSLAEACIDGACRHPCEVRNPCAPNAACVNVNHGSDCSCIEGFAGNGYVSCEPGELFQMNTFFAIEAMLIFQLFLSWIDLKFQFSFHSTSSWLSTDLSIQRRLSTE